MGRKMARMTAASDSKATELEIGEMRQCGAAQQVTRVIEGTLWFRRTRLLPPVLLGGLPMSLSKKPEGPMNTDLTADVLCYSGCGCDS